MKECLYAKQLGEMILLFVSIFGEMIWCTAYLIVSCGELFIDTFRLQLILNQNNPFARQSCMIGKENNRNACHYYTNTINNHRNRNTVINIEEQINCIAWQNDTFLSDNVSFVLQSYMIASLYYGIGSHLVLLIEGKNGLPLSCHRKHNSYNHSTFKTNKIWQ